MSNIRPIFDCECGDHCFVALTKGFMTLVSPEDKDTLDSSSWYAEKNRNTFYARSDSSKIHRLLHRAIMKPERYELIDHINCNGLDNRRSNLRPATVSQNCVNRKSIKRSKSGYIGVKETPTSWAASLNRGCGTLHLGCFSTAEEAAIARDISAIRQYGDFAILNFPVLRRLISHAERRDDDNP